MAFWPDSSYYFDFTSHLRSRVHLLNTAFVNTFPKKKQRKQGITSSNYSVKNLMCGPKIILISNPVCCNNDMELRQVIS